MNRLFEALNVAFRDGRWEEAIAVAGRMIETSPYASQGWVSLAQILLKLSDREGSLAAIRRGMLLDPEGDWHDALLSEAGRLGSPERIGRAEQPLAASVERLLRVRPATVCAAILAKNEERCIARCLDSLAGAVDEIVVLDTGSTDRTMEIVASYSNAKLLRTTWRDSFAAARNEALPHIDSDWVLWIDADEWLHPEDREAVREAAGLFDPAPIPPVLQIWHLNIVGGEVVHDFSQPRMFPLRRGLRFFGRIHNQVAAEDGVYGETPLLRRKVGIRLYHDGYDPAVLQDKRKSDRAERLLRLSRAESPDDPAWPYFLGRERFGAGRYAEAAASFEEALLLAGRQLRFGRTLELRLWLVKCAFAERRWNEARSRCEAILEETPDFPDAHYFLAQALIMQAKEKLREAEAFAMGAAESAKTYRGTVAADMSIRAWRAPVLLADLAVHRGKLAEARAIYRAYVRKAGPHADAIQRKLAFIERQRKKLEQAGLPRKR